MNGLWAGYHEGGYAPFAFDVSTLLNYGGDNVIVYRVDALPWTIRFDIIPSWFATDWQHYVGVVQDLYLEAAPPMNIVRADVIPMNTRGDLEVSVVIENRSDEQRLVRVAATAFALDETDPDYLDEPRPSRLLGGQAPLLHENETWALVPPMGFTRAGLSPRVENPDLWTPADPNLYAMRVSLEAGADEIDTFWTQFGVRTVEVGEGAKILLNRRPAFFTGMARHEDWPDTGRTATFEKIREDLEIVRETNAYFLRTAHYPNHPNTYLLTDRLGFAVWEEIPAWWIMQLNIPILLERGLPQQMWREMIWNQRNRPSVLFWSLQNEAMWYLVFNLPQYVGTLRDDFRDNYPDGRLVAQALAADGAPVTGHTVDDVDVIGWNTYYDVFYGGDATGETAGFLQWQHAIHPDTPMIVTEFGQWAGDDAGDQQKQVDIAEDTLAGIFPFAAVDDTATTFEEGFVAGVSWWCQFNWYRVQDPHVQSMGTMSMDRITEKPVRQTLADLYEPYFNSGGLGEALPDDDDDDDADDDTGDDDDAPDDDGAPDDDVDDDENADDDDNDEGGCCGC
ncbi:MAG: glycoside hydrolase family 2 [Deltaproteobacteria bacterium]|nr:glycoside hydrolase family 2 [Deltaproteobacteria bacterium]